jgi:hypothetical protein
MRMRRFYIPLLAFTALAGVGLGHSFADRDSPITGTMGSGGNVLFAPSSTIAAIGTSCTATHAGQLFLVTDATAGTEGATCAGSGSAKQLAFCNGSAWKCF